MNSNTVQSQITFGQVWKYSDIPKFAKWAGILLPHVCCVFKCLNLNKHRVGKFILWQHAGVINWGKTSEDLFYFLSGFSFIISEKVIRLWKVCIVTSTSPRWRGRRQVSELVAVCFNDVWWCRAVGCPRPEAEPPFLFFFFFFRRMKARPAVSVLITLRSSWIHRLLS